MTDDPRLDAVFAALADPTRRAIIARLLEGDATVTELAAPFEMSLAAVSKHIALLTRAGLILQSREGRTKWCRLNPDTLRPAQIWMEGLGGFGTGDLDRLEDLLDAKGLLIAPEG